MRGGRTTCAPSARPPAGREATGELIDAFTDRARQTGAATDAPHFQASIVQFTDTALRVYGAENFPASVLANVGVDRPAAQRFTDKPYLEIGVSDADLGRSPDLSAADGDIVYLSFASPAAKQRAPAILESQAWRALSANRDNRVFVVNNEVWQTGQGIVAARGILDDLRWLNAPINPAGRPAVKRVLVTIVVLGGAAVAVIATALAAIRWQIEPLLTGVRKLNRVLTNRGALRSAGTASSGTAVVVHRGRRSGRTFHPGSPRPGAEQLRHRTGLRRRRRLGETCWPTGRHRGDRW